MSRWLQLPAYSPGFAFSAGANHWRRKPRSALRKPYVPPVTARTTTHRRHDSTRLQASTGRCHGDQRRGGEVQADETRDRRAERDPDRARDPGGDGQPAEAMACVESAEADDDRDGRERREVVLAEERRLTATRVLDEADDRPGRGRGRDEREDADDEPQALCRVDEDDGTDHQRSQFHELRPRHGCGRAVRDRGEEDQGREDERGDRQPECLTREHPPFDDSHCGRRGESEQGDVRGNHGDGRRTEREIETGLVRGLEEAQRECHEKEHERRVPGSIPQKALAKAAHPDGL